MAGLCKDAGIKLLCYGSMAGGFLSERWAGKEKPKSFENRSLVKYSLIIDEFGGWEVFGNSFQYFQVLQGSTRWQYQMWLRPGCFQRPGRSCYCRGEMQPMSGTR